MINYYWWKDIDGRVGNVYAINEKYAKEKAESGFGEKVVKVELLEEKVSKNRFTGKYFDA